MKTKRKKLEKEQGGFVSDAQTSYNQTTHF
jgi:hypothetical protein